MRSLGPLTHATLLCGDADALAKTYAQHLHMAVKRTETISPQLAQMLGAPHWCDAPCLWLGPQDAGDAWLRLVQGDVRPPQRPFRTRGWIALEVLVQDVDALAAQLEHSPFELLGAPADLAVSDAIRAMQVRGAAGEVLYLTQINGEVPPFELPRASHPVDGLFIAVLAAGQRDASGAFYQRIGGDAPLEFNSRVGVLSREWQMPQQHEYPMATVQLCGSTLLEIDHLPQAAPHGDTQPPPGIASIGVCCDDVQRLGCDWLTPPRPIADFPWNGRIGACARGPDGERIEFVQSE